MSTSPEHECAEFSQLLSSFSLPECFDDKKVNQLSIEPAFLPFFLFFPSQLVNDDNEMFHLDPFLEHHVAQKTRLL